MIMMVATVIQAVMTHNLLVLMATVYMLAGNVITGMTVVMAVMKLTVNLKAVLMVNLIVVMVNVSMLAGHVTDMRIAGIQVLMKQIVVK